MSRQRKPILPKRQGARQADPRAMLQEALRSLRQGNYRQAVQQAERVLALKPAPALLASARNTLAEARFRAALTTDDLDTRLSLLDAALQTPPDNPKLHFHLGLALLQHDQPADALKEFQAAARTQPGRPGLAYLSALTRIAVVQPWDDAGLTPAEAHTLRLVSQMIRSRAPATPLPFETPILGKGTELWQALAAMRTDRTAAPAQLLESAVDQNRRKPVARILKYYRGVAALRTGDRAAAAKAWREAQAAGFTGPALSSNLTALFREEAFELAQAGRWEELAKRMQVWPVADLTADRILAETCGLAHFHLGYRAAQAGQWAQAAAHWREAEKLHGTRQLAQNLALAEEALENWEEAAEAWRDMVRRRPRKSDHPDYLTDAQVVALWAHAADCYERVDELEEAETCLRNAVKYAPSDVKLRVRLADLLMEMDRGEAAESQLNELLARDPASVEALLRLGRLYTNRWDRDAVSIWRRVLALDPTQAEARDALAAAYDAIDVPMRPYDASRIMSGQPGKTVLEVLQNGLQELPGHPVVLAALGRACSQAKQPAQARQYLLMAYEAAPQKADIAHTVLHELLHADAGDAVNELLPRVRQIPGLLPAFWFDQAATAAACQLGEAWPVRFIEEGLALIGQPWVDDTPAGLLLDAYELAKESHADALAAALTERIRKDYAHTGAVQYLEAYRLNFEKFDNKGAAGVMREAIKLAKHANDQGVLRRAERIDALLKGRLPPVLENMFRDLFR